MFHYRDGLFFKKLEDNVLLIKTTDGMEPRDGNILFETTIDGNGWCSIIASMSNYGEGNGGYGRADNFHRGM